MVKSPSAGLHVPVHAFALRREAAISAGMAWLRSPVLFGAVFLVLGVVLRVILSFPEGETRTFEDLRRAMIYQRDHQPATKLEPRYRPYAVAFILAGSDEEVAAIKRAIDAELAAAEAVRARGLAGVPDYVGERLVATDVVLMALGAALLFRSLAFVLAVGFGAGAMHELLAQSASLTGAPSEFYLAAVLAALLWSALFWLVRALYEGRLRFS